ncbi:unnamed protein product, partial [Gongylonema pulchrum]|uniref:Protein FAR1-RELATED SEQUENCE n=1 Tax=Gongylonema pulchrum TaxID=637853 RepID=A0A183DBP9_9BILA
MKEEVQKSIGGEPPDFTNLPDTKETEEQCKTLTLRIMVARQSGLNSVISEEALNALESAYEQLRKNYVDAKKIVLCRPPFCSCGYDHDADNDNDYDDDDLVRTNLGKFFRKMKERIKLRKATFLEVRNNTTKHLCDVYSCLMSVRNFKGKLLVNHDEKTISITAQTQHGQDANRGHRKGANVQDLR